jgi:hypothetical protein
MGGCVTSRASSGEDRLDDPAVHVGEPVVAPAGSSTQEASSGSSSLTSMPDRPRRAKRKGEAIKFSVVVRASLGFSNGSGLS